MGRLVPRLSCGRPMGRPYGDPENLAYIFDYVVFRHLAIRTPKLRGNIGKCVHHSNHAMYVPSSEGLKVSGSRKKGGWDILGDVF